MRHVCLGVFAGFVLASVGCDSQEGFEPEDPASGGKADDADAEQGFSRYRFAFEGRMFGPTRILSQEASFDGSFSLGHELRNNGEREIREFSFALELGDGVIDDFVPYAVRALEHTRSYSNRELGREGEEVEIILEAEPVVEAGLEQTILRGLEGSGRPRLQLQLYCERGATERFTADPQLHNCHLGCVFSGVSRNGDFEGSPDYLLNAESTPEQECGPVDLTRLE